MNRVVDWLMRRETKEPEPQFVSLGDHAATLLVAIASPLETLFVHLGDGYGFGLKIEGDDNCRSDSKAVDCFFPKTENTLTKLTFLQMKNGANISALPV